MKKILLSIVICILASSLVLAQGQGIHEPGTGIENPEIKEAGQGTGQGLEVNTETETQQQNQGEATLISEQVQTQGKIQAGTYSTANGKQLEVQTQSNNRVQLKSGAVAAETVMEMTQEQTQTGIKLQVKLSNGKNAEVKVMPDTASEKALERLRMKVCSSDNACSIELKEVGQGEQVRAAYEVQAQKQAKMLGLFKTKMQVQAQVDAESGEVIQTKKPWWAFLASEPEE